METIFCDRRVITLPYALNPVKIFQDLFGGVTCHQGRFKTSVVCTYNPNVPASTIGQVCIACTATPVEDFRTLAAASPNVIVPVWKKATLTIKRSRLSVQNWQRENDTGLWLCGHGTQGTLTITCTIQVIMSQKQSRSPIEISTRAVVGPRIAGFSLSYYGAPPLMPASGGQVINVDLYRSTATLTTALYIRTPENKPYIVVRYGWYTCTFKYNSANANLSWYNDGRALKSYSAPTNSHNGDRPSFWGHWARIKGNTSWWCETHPDPYPFSTLGRAVIQCGRPYCILFIYYDYGPVDIFASDFSLTPQVLPNICQPIDGPDLEPGYQVPITLHGMVPFLMCSAEWRPNVDLNSIALRNYMESWPCDTRDHKRTALPPQLTEEEEKEE